MQTFSVDTRQHTQFVNIDRQVQAAVNESGVKRGVVHVHVPHTTAGITINENADPDVVADMITILSRLVPWEGGYSHGEGNTAAHMKSSMLGHSVSVLIENGELQFGTWQSIFFCEFDGPRSRNVWVQVFSNG